MAQSIYITSAEGHSGKSTVALGVLETLGHATPRVGVFRAIARSTKERGYVLFRRHWMEFVELSSRPEGPDVLHEPSQSGLRVEATPGEHEPVTFSIWPLRDLEDVTLRVSPLQAANGATIPIPSVVLCRRKPITSVEPSVISPIA